MSFRRSPLTRSSRYKERKIEVPSNFGIKLLWQCIAAEELFFVCDRPVFFNTVPGGFERGLRASINRKLREAVRGIPMVIGGVGFLSRPIDEP